MLVEVNPSKVIMGRLFYGKDLLQELNLICNENNIKLGRIEALGAVQRASLGYYRQPTHEYHFFVLEQPLEITKLVGNISLKESNPFVHAHITLADEQGKTYGGHLADGTIVFACEYIIQVFEGPDLHRLFDEQTGLPLWQSAS